MRTFILTYGRGFSRVGDENSEPAMTAFDSTPLEQLAKEGFIKELYPR
jgi:hypothetical protein